MSHQMYFINGGAVVKPGDIIYVINPEKIWMRTVAEQKSYSPNAYFRDGDTIECEYVCGVHSAICEHRKSCYSTLELAISARLILLKNHISNYTKQIEKKTREVAELEAYLAETTKKAV